MKIRHVCAIAGVAIAVAIVVFMQSLVATNDYQSESIAASLIKEVPIARGEPVAQLAVDYRPDGRVMQGPPMMATVVSGRDGLKYNECIVTKSLFAQRHLETPPIGTELTLIGKNGAYRVKIAAILDWGRPLRGYPNMFVNKETAAAISERWDKWVPKSIAELAPGFRSDAERNFDRAKALLLWGAALTALCLLLNSLLLSIESGRKETSLLRVIGLTRFGVVKRVLVESLILSSFGVVLGCGAGVLMLAVYVAADSATYPLGWTIDKGATAICAILAPIIALVASIIAIKPALAIKPLDNLVPRKRHLGMIIAFSCGFGAFVAVEVWGASLMSAFVPSPEWPDAIVSILPGGVSSFDITKLQQSVKGVRKIHELAPLQVNLDPLEEMESRGPIARGKQYRNALLLGSDWLPDFKFISGDKLSAEKAIHSGDNCIITEMMARARRLKLGDYLHLDCGRGLKLSLKIVGIVDLNWHMVTSRGLLRGLNRMPINTDGPVFVSFDMVEACDARPPMMVKMTHLWLDYDTVFLQKHGVFEAGRIVEHNIVESLGLLKTEVANNVVRLHTRGEIADGTLAHGVEIIGAMARVPFIFIAVISLGFIAMLVASVEYRCHEFSIMRAVGATRVQLAQLLLAETAKIIAYGLFLGLIGGSLIGWLCTYGTRAAMANWGLPPSFAIPWCAISLGAAGAIVFALLVAIPSAFIIISKANKR